MIPRVLGQRRPHHGGGRSEGRPLRPALRHPRHPPCLPAGDDIDDDNDDDDDDNDDDDDDDDDPWSSCR